MPIPDFTDSGGLPIGEHQASWAELCERFAQNDHRAELARKLGDGARALRLAGCTRIWINGSFVTDIAYPNDVDVLYNAREVRFARLSPAFRDQEKRKERFGGDYLAIDMDTHLPERPEGLMKFFRTDRDGQLKGIVVLSLSTVPLSEG